MRADVWSYLKSPTMSEENSLSRSSFVGALCLDLDGTLYGSNHTISARNAAAVARASRCGYAVALCTGRSLNCHLPVQALMDAGVQPLFLVGCNGAVVCRLADDGSPADMFFETKLSEANIDRIALGLGAGRAQKADVGKRQFFGLTSEADDRQQRELVEAHNLIESTSPEWLDDFAASLKALLLEGHAPNKMTVLDVDCKRLEEEVATMGELEGIRLVMGGPMWADTVDVAHDKAAGIQLLCERLGFAMADCVAMGDGANDASMLAAVGLGIAMAQGREEAKRAATRVSEWTNDEDAVAREIDHLLSLREGG